MQVIQDRLVEEKGALRSRPRCDVWKDDCDLKQCVLRHDVQMRLRLARGAAVPSRHMVESDQRIGASEFQTRCNACLAKR